MEKTMYFYSSMTRAAAENATAVEKYGDANLIFEEIKAANKEAVAYGSTRIWPLKYFSFENGYKDLARDAVRTAEETRVWAAQKYFEYLKEAKDCNIRKIVFIIDVDDFSKEKTPRPEDDYGYQILKRLAETESDLVAEDHERIHVIVGEKEIETPRIPNGIQQSYSLAVRSLSTRASEGYRERLNTLCHDATKSFIGLCDTWPERLYDGSMSSSLSDLL